MSPDEFDVARLRIRMARETLADARHSAAGGRWRTCSNRLYYASFYAVLGLLAIDGLGSSKHSGVRAIFNKEYVNKGIVPVHFGRFYSNLLAARMKSDYVLEAPLPTAEIAEWLAEADSFIDTIELLILSREHPTRE